MLRGIFVSKEDKEMEDGKKNHGEQLPILCSSPLIGYLDWYVVHTHCLQTNYGQYQKKKQHNLLYIICDISFRINQPFDALLSVHLEKRRSINKRLIQRLKLVHISIQTGPNLTL